MKLATIALLICFSFVANAAQDIYEKVALGMKHACAITNSGNVKCWGLNEDGQATPPANLKDVIEIRLGTRHSCAVDKFHFLTCWGLYQNQFPKELESVRVKTSFSTKRGVTCAIRESDGVPFCWGENNNAYDVQLPPNLDSLDDISVGTHGICFTKKGGVSCSGDFNEAPPSNLNNVKSVVIGNDGVICAIDSGSPICWNNVYSEQLPPANFGKVLAIDVGWTFGCGILQSHQVGCWGKNWKGAHEVPIDLGPVKSLSVNSDSSCAITLSGNIRCWGSSPIQGE